MLPRPAGVLFDAGGTLVQLGADRLRAELRRRGHDPGDIDEAFWRTLILLDSEFGPATGEFEGWWRRWQLKLAEQCNVEGEAFCEVYKAVDREAFLWDTPIDGAVECLTRLREADIRVGVVSNADGRVAEALGRAGLADLLEVIVDSGVVGVAKPDPAIFAHALRPLGLRVEETWYLGDTVLYDAAAADAAGLQSWVVDHRGLHTLAHPRRVRSLTEFADAVLAAA